MTTQVFTGSLQGTYDGTNFSNAAQITSFSGYFDKSNGDTQFAVGDPVVYHYDSSGGTDYSETAPFTYAGYYTDANGIQYPLVTTGGQYYLFGQPADMSSFPITSANFTQASDNVCYGAGTLIRTVRGDVAVEHLAVGDLVLTSAGVHAPVRWLGHRTLYCRNHPRPDQVLPIRIAAHAFGPDKPARDLFVSPAHAICVDVCGEVLIPAHALVNGSTIQQADVDAVTYWHVELDDHDILLAENLPAESYLDMGNRGFFQETGVVDLAAGPDVTPHTHAAFCRPFHSAGALVEVVRAQLAARALALGWSLDESDPTAGLHLVVDGARIDPLVRGLSARFAIPTGATAVALVSDTSRPCDVDGSGDARLLGVCVGGLTMVDGFAQRKIAIDDPLLRDGLHPVEDGVRRWTAGRVDLPAALFASCRADFFLRVDLAGPALPKWVAPPAMVAPHDEDHRPAAQTSGLAAA